MRASKRTLLFFLLLGMIIPFAAGAQDVKLKQNVVIDYNNPQKYILADIAVSGVKHVSKEQVLAITGLAIGDQIEIPGDEIASIVKRLYMQRLFSDVAVQIDSLQQDSIYLNIRLTERPIVSAWEYTGVKKSEKTELQERLKLRRGGELSDFIIKSSSDIIKRYYMEKGFLNAAVSISQQADTVIQNAVKVLFNVNKGDKIRIKTINFIGNTNVKDQKLRFAMKKTKDNHIFSFFSSKKFDEKEYPNDKQLLIQKFQEKGYFDVRIVRDSIYHIDKKKLGIDIVIEQGQKYYFRNITWTGNSIFSTEFLNQVLMIKKGDVFDVVTMEKRLYDAPEGNVRTYYNDEGYLFCNIEHVEYNIFQDSIDVEMRVFEGKPANFNNIVINGNTITNEKIIRRQLRTRPGYLFTRTEFERSVRELMSSGLFNEEKVATGAQPIPNPRDNTVDIVYNLEEKPSSNLEVAGGWGGNTFVGTLGVSFNNFSARRIFHKNAWRPVPLGDGQNLALRFQTDGMRYTALSASFMEPWLLGKKPTSFSTSAYYTRQTTSTIYYKTTDYMEVLGLSAGLGTMLKWPDDYFTLYNELSLQRYKLHEWPYDFMFSNGTSYNLSWKIRLQRNSTDATIYPRKGSDFLFSLQLTPPYSLFKSKDTDYTSMSSDDRYKWIEYHKWVFQGTLYTPITKDLVLMARAHWGYLGYYNKDLQSPFEGFVVGGDGMSGYNTYGSDIIGLRGYKNGTLTPRVNGAYAGNVYDKFTLELRYPIILEPQSTIYALVFLEGGNCWSNIRDFNPFSIKRAAGVGVRVLLPIVGMLGIDWGYGFDPISGQKASGSNFHFLIGQQF